MDKSNEINSAKAYEESVIAVVRIQVALQMKLQGESLFRLQEQQQ
jgi:hypothetical protein